MKPHTPLRRALCSTFLAASLSVTALALAAPARAHPQPGGHLAPVAECAPDDQACKDREKDAEQEKEVEERQNKTDEDAKKADQTIKDVGKQLEECKPGAGSCMDGLTGPGMGEKQGITDMTSTIKENKAGPAGDASEAVTSTCSHFPASLPAGSADSTQSPFPVAQLCALLGG
ncbi:hypothetical protein [Streptomyces yangpuensis]|uniref:hypothetical protein n=1 Tax=Streptomyces yangpuensis TaxID=1648182 RepID=UPI003829CF9C